MRTQAKGFTKIKRNTGKLTPPDGGAVVKYRRALEINDYDADSTL
ncbi:hypothetical protein [Thalassobacterium sedimentorum]|nr:hypothetical protein [Coraliomargarita sp. SDUM461004]